MLILKVKHLVEECLKLYFMNQHNIILKNWIKNIVKMKHKN